MNECILDLAATYVNAYRTACQRRKIYCDASVLRGNVTKYFGAIYASILVQ